MKWVWVSAALLFCHGAAAQDGSAMSSGVEEVGAQAAAAKADQAAEGDCAPIGLTARGELVFPLQCRQVRERGPVSNDTTSSAPQVASPASQPAAQAVVQTAMQQKVQPIVQSALQPAAEPVIQHELVEPVIRQEVALPDQPVTHMLAREIKLSAIRQYKKRHARVGIATIAKPN